MSVCCLHNTTHNTPLSPVQSLNVLLYSLRVANKALEVRQEEMDGERAKTEEKLKERIAELEKELENANELLSDGKHRGECISLWMGECGTCR